jgi:tetratricopeptide (TPR) repeat protein
MSGEANPIQTKEELDTSLEAAYKSGDLGLVALLVWETLQRFPDDAGVARIYSKKLLRDDYIQSLDFANLKKNLKVERESGTTDEAARIAAVGLLKFPKNRHFLLNFLVTFEDHRPHLIKYVIEELGEPDDDDVVLLNANAAFAQQQGDYAKAYAVFKKLVRIEPENFVFIQNLSAAMTGLGKYEAAINILEAHIANAPEPKEFLQRLSNLYRQCGQDVEEKLLQLDVRCFQECKRLQDARAHADIMLFLQNLPAAKLGVEKALEYKFNPDYAFELSEAELALGNFQAGLDRYDVRFDAFPGLRYCSPKGKPYQGERLTTESLLIWSEQGIGEEILFCYFYKFIAERVQNVTLAASPRLMPFLARIVPNWQLINRHPLERNTPPPECDYSCPAGDLFRLFALDVLTKKIFLDYPLFAPSSERLKSVSTILGKRTKPRIGLSWRGGRKTNGKIRSMTLAQALAGLPKELDIDIVSLQYTEDHEQEVFEQGDRRVALSGLDNRNDFDGIFALITQCDAVISIDNAVAHFAAALGCPTMVVVPAGQIQFRWKNERFRTVFFPSAEIFTQSSPGSWNTAVEAAWSRALALSSPDHLDG